MSAIFIDCPTYEAGFLTPELRDIVPGLAVNTGAPPLHALLIRNVSYHACFRGAPHQVLTSAIRRG